MTRLIWSRAALSDVARLRNFLVGKNPDAARRAVRAIRATVQVIAQQPGIGRPVAELPAEFREWLIEFGDSGYVLLYRFDGTIAAILAVRHQREVGYR